jgi:hypothetical protein
MIVAAHQPNFLPWLGFFDKLARADRLVLLDDVQFPRTSAGTWSNRVRVLVGGRAAWLTVPVMRDGLQAIREVRIDDRQPWRRKAIRTLEQSYRRAPHFADVFPVVRELLEHDTDRLAELNETSIRRLAELIGIDAGKLARQSRIGAEGRATELLIALVRAVGGTAYLSGDGADGYQEEGAYGEAGLQLRLQGFRHPVYPQPASEFVPGLSIVDALMNVGAERTRELLSRS